MVAEFIDRIGKVGADEGDLSIAARILAARATLALADAMHGGRQQLTLTSSQLGNLITKIEALTRKVPAVD